MNDKVTLPGLVNLLAQKTGDTKKQSEDFIKELFATVTAALADGDTVKIKDLGVFKTVTVEARKSVNVSTGEDIEIPAHRKVAFVPSKELAAMVNEPFEMFETVELADDAEDADLVEEMEQDSEIEAPLYSVPDEYDSTEERIENREDGTETDLTSESEQKFESEPEYEPETEPELEPEQEPKSEQVQESESPTEPETRTIPKTESVSTQKPEVNPVYDAKPEVNSEDGMEPEQDMVVTHHHGANRFILGFLTGVITACVIGAICMFGMKWMHDSDVAKTDIEKIAKVEEQKDEELIKDTVIEPAPVEKTAEVEKPEKLEKAEQKDEVAPTKPSDEKVYDTISTTRYLTTMAKDHYGNYNLWPYIYMENSAFLGHPDRIKPGTKVVIPDLKKYGVNPKNPDDIAKAKRKGVEIYSRYK